jgi:hypothetical protein
MTLGEQLSSSYMLVILLRRGVGQSSRLVPPIHGFVMSDSVRLVPADLLGRGKTDCTMRRAHV